MSFYFSNMFSNFLRQLNFADERFCDILRGLCFKEKAKTHKLRSKINRLKVLFLFTLYLQIIVKNISISTSNVWEGDLR